MIPPIPLPASAACEVAKFRIAEHMAECPQCKRSQAYGRARRASVRTVAEGVALANETRALTCAEGKRLWSQLEAAVLAAWS